MDETFIYWAVERDLIRRRRIHGMTPLTNDPILRDYRFCNVSREDDAVTVWIKNNIRDPFDAAGNPEATFRAVALARFLNQPAALEALLDEGALQPGVLSDLRAVASVVRRHKAMGGQTFNAAYMVACVMNPRMEQFGAQDKISYVCGNLSTAVMPTAKSRQGFVHELKVQYGFAEFMAGQIAADLAYTSILRDAPDHMTWSPRGPGAMRGMNWALGKPIDRIIEEKEYLEIGRLQLSMLPVELVEDRRLTLHDVASNVNCETSKYMRARERNEMPKRKFK